MHFFILLSENYYYLLAIALGALLFLTAIGITWYFNTRQSVINEHGSTKSVSFGNSILSGRATITLGDETEDPAQEEEKDKVTTHKHSLLNGQIEVEVEWHSLEDNPDVLTVKNHSSKAVQVFFNDVDDEDYTPGGFPDWVWIKPGESLELVNRHMEDNFVVEASFTDEPSESAHLRRPEEF